MFPRCVTRDGNRNAQQQLWRVFKPIGGHWRGIAHVPNGNLRLRDDWLAEQLIRAVQDERLGIPPASDPQTIVIDYSSPNVAKPMHVGHIRSTVIGDALTRTLRFLGHRVISDNHIGDWGTQFGMIIYGYKHFADDDAYQANPVAELGRLYKLVNRLVDYRESVKGLPAQKDRLIERLLQHYDHVVIDSPPVMGLADAPLIASRVEGVIYAVESHGIRSTLVKTALARLASANARIFGGVLTKFEARKAHYGYGYHYGYNYGREKADA